MTRRFTMQRGTTRVVFERGSTARLAEEIEALGLRRVLVLCTPRRTAAAEQMAGRLGERSQGIFAGAAEHVPAEIVAEARRAVSRVSADCVLAFGGGSAIGLAKAIALAEGVRIVAVPTTYSGSEMTPIYGITENGTKRTGRDERARASLVVYDSALTTLLPKGTTVASLWNGMAHALEALWIPDGDRATRRTAEDGLRLMASSLLRLVAHSDDHAARDDALEGAYLAGAAFADAGSGPHHRLCHVLGGMLGLPHAATHAVLAPHFVRFFAEASPEAMRAIARALSALDAASAVERLAQASGAPRSLEALGMPRDAITRVANEMLTTPTKSPRPIERAELVDLLERAWTASPVRPPSAPVRAPDHFRTQPGFAGTHDSEALEGALPRLQNTPRPAPYGLYPELLSGTPFTVRNAENSKMWMYRVRASFSHGELRPVAAPHFAAPFEDAFPNRTRWSPLPIPAAPERVDFVDGIVTLGGAGDHAVGPGYAIHLYAANADMADRAFSNADGDLLIVPQSGTLDLKTELGWLRVPPGSIALIPRAMKFAVGLPDGGARGWIAEVFGTRFRLPERGPIGSNGLADARHFLAPTAWYEDRLCPGGFEIVHKLGGTVYAAMQEHSPFDVVAWHGTHAPFVYDLTFFNAMGSVTFDHVDPSIHTVLTAPLDDHGRAVCDFVVFRGRWDVAEHSFRPPFMHRNAASEINGVVKNVGGGDYAPGCTFVSPLLTAHGIATKSYDEVLDMPDDVHEGPRRLSDDSLWIMFESALPFRRTAWARETPLVDKTFPSLFQGMRCRFDPNRA